MFCWLFIATSSGVRPGAMETAEHGRQPANTVIILASPLSPVTLSVSMSAARQQLSPHAAY